MNEGISFDEACEQTPNSLTAQQLQSCPGQQSSTQPYLYIGILGVIVVIVLICFTVIKLKKTKKSS